MRVPNEHRITTGPQATTAADGNCGAFRLRMSENSDLWLFCIASDGLGWEHVSVTVQESTSCWSEHHQTRLVGWSTVKRTPTWAEMCFVRNAFWSQHVTVLQFHPPAAEYVNRHPYCLHLWRQPGIDVPRPRKELVG